LNIILIGMPGAGKSTVGIVLAKTLGYSFIDTDIEIQNREKRLLQNIIDKDGLEKFLKIEEEVLLSLQCENSVIATGGSAVYSKPAMHHLGREGKIIHLNLSLLNIEKRLNNIKTRGIAMQKGQSISKLYQERSELYKKYEEVSINCDNLSVEEIVEVILKMMEV
jgi:shikimate kinase